MYHPSSTILTGYQEETQMSQKFEKIWFLSDEDMQLLLKYVVMGSLHDRGTLQTSSGQLTFQSNNHQLIISDVQALSLFHLKSQKNVQNIVVALIATTSLLTLLAALVLGIYFYNMRSVTSLPPTLFAVLEVLLLMGFLISTFALMIHFSSKGPLGSSRWIKVEYHDEQKNDQTAYFADGSWNGWGGIFGRTHHLYTYLKQEFSNHKKEVLWHTLNGCESGWGRKRCCWCIRVWWWRMVTAVSSGSTAPILTVGACRVGCWN
jgi:hypothetical protein